MYHPFYLVQSQGLPRNHHALFVRLSTASECSHGRLFNVTGNIMTGMVYETIEPAIPESSLTFIGMEKLGWVSDSDVHRIDGVCRDNPPPAKQFEGVRRIDSKVPLRRCQEWTKETIQFLRDRGILQEVQVGSSSEIDVRGFGKKEPQ